MIPNNFIYVWTSAEVIPKWILSRNRGDPCSLNNNKNDIFIITGFSEIVEIGFQN
jgi:hypothetical protein